MAKSFEDALLQSSPPPKLALESFHGYLASLSEDQFKTLLATVKRAFARNPKAACLTGLAVFSSVQITLDSYLNEIFEILKPALKVDAPEVLGPITHAIGNLLRNATSRDDALSVIKNVATFLEGSYSLPPLRMIVSLLLLTSSW